MGSKVPALDTTGLPFPKRPKVKRGKRTPAAEEAVVPIRLRWDELLKHMRWTVQVAWAWDNIREELLARQGGKCAAGCGATVYLDFAELHHRRGKGVGGGKKCDGPCCMELLCKDTLLGDGTVRLGCHTLCHKQGDLRERFRRVE